MKTTTRVDDYTEDTLVEQPAIEVFRNLGWEVANAFPETVTSHPITDREQDTDVVLSARLLRALQNLNPEILEEGLKDAIDQIIADRSTKLPERANQEVYQLIKDGVQVSFQKQDGETAEERVRVIDWDNPQNNDFFLVSQLWVSGDLYRRRPDLVGYVNGIPLVFVELKAIHRNLRNAFDGNLRDYRKTIPKMFWYNAIVILSNLLESGIGTITSPYEHFTEWKKVEGEDDVSSSSLETMIRGTCDPSRLLDIVENFILFHEGKKGLEKYVARYHQYHGVNNAIKALKNIEENQGRLGVFWHTQGSGKSFSMVFFSQKALRRIKGGYTFVVVTDRKELDSQIYRNFANSGVIYEPEDKVHAEDSEHLKQLLKEDHRYVFTLIHKFRTKHGEDHPKVSGRSDVIVITDEAHRTQYDTFAGNMRNALPNAAFIGFTGTPLIVGEEKTKKEFGDYVSIYNFAQSVDDNATVPLYYENRVPELQLINESFDKDMLYHLIARDDRLEKIAEDIVEHFTSRGHMGKAMVISIDQLTTVKMYEKVQKYWQQKIDRLSGEIESITKSQPDLVEQAHIEELKALIAYMKKTDMAVVISSRQNEIDYFDEHGIDIKPHRRRIVTENLDVKFKDADDPLRIAFLCAMWITGFDAKPCSTIYLDKPMRNHTLMQTIARANRVFRDKQNGMIVDYIGIFTNLRKALSIYGSFSDGGTREGDMPVKVKDALVDELRKAIDDADRFCRERGIYLSVITESRGVDRGMLIKDAANAMMKDDKAKRQFLSLVSSVNLLFRAIKPDPREAVFKSTRKALEIISRRIRSLTEVVDVSQVMDDINDLLDRSVAAEPYVMPEDPVEHLTTDLSKIDFEALKKQFAKGRKWTYVQRLRSITQQRLRKLVRLNKSRISYMKRLQQMIDDYNEGRMDVDQFFNELVKLAEELDEEEQRHVQEKMTEEELAAFDLLTKPPDKLSKKDRELVKKVAQYLLRTLKEKKLVLDWKKTQQTRASVRVAIEEELDKLPEVYTQELYQEKCNVIYQHVYESYWGEDQNIYTAA
jgi:type I restriction enzyme R subunit